MMKVEGLSNMEIIRFVGNDGIIHGDTCSPVGKQICRMVINETSRYLLVDDPGWPFPWESKKNIKQLRINCCPKCWDFFVGGFASPQLTSENVDIHHLIAIWAGKIMVDHEMHGYTSSSNKVIWATNRSLAERCSMLPPLFIGPISHEFAESPRMLGWKWAA